MSKNDPAFPVPPHHINLGLSKREYAAVQLLAAAMVGDEKEEVDWPQCIKHCIKLADDLFEELYK